MRTSTRCWRKASRGATSPTARRGDSDARIASPGLVKEAYSTLAEAYRQLGRTEESRLAMEQFEQLDGESSQIREKLRMLAIVPDDHETRAMLGLLYMRQGRYEEAAEAYRLATRLAPDSSRYHNNLGNAHLRLKEYDAAIQAYSKAVRLAPKYGLGLFNLGLAYLHNQRFDEAKQALLQTQNLLPEHADAPYYLGLIYGREGDYEKAAEMFERAVAARPAFLDARQKLAVSYIKLGRHEEGKKELQIIKDMQEAGSPK